MFTIGNTDTYNCSHYAELEGFWAGTIELTGRRGYTQASIQSIKLRNTCLRYGLTGCLGRAFTSIYDGPLEERLGDFYDLIFRVLDQLILKFADRFELHVNFDIRALSRR
ncbi:MAG: hypothetical protein QOF62_1005 [Pyrinomonadaceae bacterium]|nr:hypothetical protein [Pyrinomonadaceae bacterium]